MDLSTSLAELQDSVDPAATEPVATATAVRTTKGTFAPGISGNPNGRAKGSRNKITLQRLELEEAMRGDLGKVGRKILKKAIELALDGNEAMLKLLLDKSLATLRNEDVGETRDTEIRVEINNLTAVNRDRAAPGALKVIDVTPTLEAKVVPLLPTETSTNA